MNDISFDAFVGYLESVVDAVGLERIPLLGISQGCSSSIAYAVRHPERVTHLVLYGGYARCSGFWGSEQDRKRNAALKSLILNGWGMEISVFHQVFTSLFFPDGTAEQAQWFNDLQRITTTPENAYRIRDAGDQLDRGGFAV